MDGWFKKRRIYCNTNDWVGPKASNLFIKIHEWMGGGG